MADSVRLRSPAKINLDLRVLEKRPDGFHELRTIFQTVSLADTIDLEYRPGPTRIDLVSSVDIPDNIVVRAAHGVLKAVRKTGRVRVRLTKRIPMGGGLGGGSSNAAAILLALPVLVGRPIAMEDLIEIGAGLGSDVPFFLTGGACAGIGRGTECYPLPDLPAWPAILVAPGIHVSTAEAYRALERGGDPNPEAVRNFQAVVSRMRSGQPDKSWHNDFEAAVFRMHPQLKRLKTRLRSLGAFVSLMTGSGSTVFGIFEGRELRDGTVAALHKESLGVRAIPVTLLSRSRYQAMWRRQLGTSVDPEAWPPRRG